MSDRKFVVITGVSRGLGRALAVEFAGAGHTVAGCARNELRVAALRNVLGLPHEFSQVDVTDDAAVTAWGSGIMGRLGAPDLLINNAAVINRNAPLWRVSAEEFGHVVDVNLKGVVNVIRAFVPSMIARGSGVVVNLSSGWGRSTDAEVAPYCATKWAIEGLTQALAQELPTGMAAVPLNPGVIDTDMLRSCFGGSAEMYQGPEAWARTAVPFLLALGSEDNGHSLTVGA